MLINVHLFMKNTNNIKKVFVATKENYMPSNPVLPIAYPYICFLPSAALGGQTFYGFNNVIMVFIRLFQ